MAKRKTRFTIGICAYNEEKTVGRLLTFLLKEKFNKVQMDEIVVVASGCTDKTEEVVLEFCQKDKRVKLIVEKERRGKSPAVNKIIQKSKSKIIVLISADIVPSKGAIEKLVVALRETGVGMVGGRPIPRNKPNNLVGFAVNLQWNLHHLISLKRPKPGEMVAFKKVFKRIHPKSAVDEAIVECLVAIQGYEIRYVPRAIVYNKGPETIRDFLRQRRRIYAGHLATKRHYGYVVSTFDAFKIVPYLLKVMEPNWQFFVFTPLVAFLELTARTTGWLDYHFRIRDHSIWKIAETTKKIR
jgi:biofilm PGA synthesis N-glycosyltransferase PgaC